MPSVADEGFRTVCDTEYTNYAHTRIVHACVGAMWIWLSCRAAKQLLVNWLTASMPALTANTVPVLWRAVHNDLSETYSEDARNHAMIALTQAFE